MELKSAVKIFEAIKDNCSINIEASSVCAEEAFLIPGLRMEIEFCGKRISSFTCLGLNVA